MRQWPAGCRSPAAVRPRARATDWRHSRMPITRTMPNPENNGMNITMTSIDSGTVPCLGSSARLVAGRSTKLAAGRSTERSAACRESHTRSCASAWPFDTPGFSRPTMLTLTDSVALPLAGAELAKHRERRPEIRRRDRLESSKVLRHHADNAELRSVYPDRCC